MAKTENEPEGAESPSDNKQSDPIAIAIERAVLEIDAGKYDDQLDSLASAMTEVLDLEKNPAMAKAMARSIQMLLVLDGYHITPISPALSGRVH